MFLSICRAKPWRCLQNEVTILFCVDEGISGLACFDLIRSLALKVLNGFVVCHGLVLRFLQTCCGTDKCGFHLLALRMSCSVF